MEPDYRDFCNLEKYLFTHVHDRFHQTGKICPEDFYMIIVWKGNRAKRYARERLSNKEGGFSASVEKIASSLNNCASKKDRLEVIMKEWGFRLSVASAILTVLYPKDFSIYDVRVCGELNSFKKLANHRFSNRLWDEYKKYIEEVRKAAPKDYSLRDKDHFLWGRSFYNGIKNDLDNSKQSDNSS